MIRKITASQKDKECLLACKSEVSAAEIAAYDYRYVVVKKPWGHEYLALQNDESAVWLMHLDKGSETSLHCHLTKKTALVVLAGNILLSTLDDQVNLSCGDGAFIEKGVFHSSYATSAPKAVVMEVETPNNKGDLVRLQDRYGRAGKRYESGECYVPRPAELASFHNDKGNYVSRQIGKCMIAISRYPDTYDLKDEIKTVQAASCVVLKGGIGNSAKGLFACADLVSIPALQSFDVLHTIGSTELLFIHPPHN